MDEDLSPKIQELEKQLRKKTRTFAGVLGVVVVLLGCLVFWAFCHGFPAVHRVKSDSFQADNFVSVWPEVIMTERTEGGTVGVLQENGKHTLFRLSEILWTEEAPSTSFTSRPRVQLLANDEQTGLLLYDRSGNVRAQLVVSDDQSKLVLLDKTGKEVFSAP